MKITIIQIGKTKNHFVEEAEQEYRKRLQTFAKIEVLTLKEAIIAKGVAASQREIAKNKEGQAILTHLSRNSFIIALTETGQSLSSLKFAQFLQNQRDFEGGNVTFIIGGPYGLSMEVLQQARLKLSFSAFTFTHEIIRILLMEQLYRAFTILKGKTYHY